MEKRGSRSRKTSELLTQDQSKRFQGKTREKELGERNQRILGEGEERKKRRKGRTWKTTWKRESPSRWKRREGIQREKAVKREELVIERQGLKKEERGGVEVSKERRRKLDQERKRRLQRIVEKREKKVEGRERNQGPKKDVRKEWKEQVVRVGTGFRVRKHEKDQGRRRFDVGYADRKTYKRKPGREAVVDQSSMGRTVRGKGEEARVKVMNAVCEMEKRRPASEYTGSGIRRKSQVGKRKLKPTKPQAKQ